MKTNDFWKMFVGAILGTIVGYYIYDNYISEIPKSHLCKCEMCKIQRQLETCELLDSIFLKERAMTTIQLLGLCVLLLIIGLVDEN